MVQLAASITELGTATLDARPVVGVAASIAELGVATGSQQRQLLQTASVQERGKAKATSHAGYIRQVHLAALGIASVKTRVATGVSLHSMGQAFDRVRVFTGIRMLERGQASIIQKTQAIYHKALFSRGKVSDILGRPGIAAFLASLGRVTDALVTTYQAVAAFHDTAIVTDHLERQLLLTVIHDETVEISDSLTLRAVWMGYLSDRADFILDLVSPGGDVTTWAMNTRTGAITEYLDYSFNAFAKSGSNTYLGAADDGLYELVGPDDAGQSIKADIIGGVTDFGGTFLTGMKAAYLGIRGTGEFFLKLTAGDGKTYTYAVKSRNLQTTRVDIGKGLRATYFTWELLSTGQDFDLLDVTFLPIQQTRRV